MNIKEEKCQRFLDAQEHPEKYTDEQLDAIIHDNADIVNLKRAFMQERADHETIDTDIQPRHQWIKIVAAFAGGIVITSVAFAAIVGLGIVSSPLARNDESAIAVVAKDTINNVHAATTANGDSTTQKPKAVERTVKFDNVPLSKILNDMAAYYNVEVSFNDNSNAHDIRLCFEWDRLKSLTDNIALLNSFQQINIVQEGKRLVVE